jgi:hypothetical protein
LSAWSWPRVAVADLLESKNARRCPRGPSCALINDTVARHRVDVQDCSRLIRSGHLPCAMVPCDSPLHQPPAISPASPEPPPMRHLAPQFLLVQRRVDRRVDASLASAKRLLTDLSGRWVPHESKRSRRETPRTYDAATISLPAAGAWDVPTVSVDTTIVFAAFFVSQARLCAT